MTKRTRTYNDGPRDQWIEQQLALDVPKPISFAHFDAIELLR
jgi:hypothetical protein